MVVALLLVPRTPLVVTLTSSNMHPNTFALLPRPLSATRCLLRCRRYLPSKSLGTHLFHIEAATVTDPASPSPLRAVSSPTSDSSSVEE